MGRLMQVSEERAQAEAIGYTHYRNWWFEIELAGDFRAVGAGAQARVPVLPTGVTEAQAESWAVRPAASQFCQASMKRPSLMRTMEIPVVERAFPVDLSRQSTVQRSETRSPSQSAITGVTRVSAKRDCNASKKASNSGGPRICTLPS